MANCISTYKNSVYMSEAQPDTMKKLEIECNYELLFSFTNNIDVVLFIAYFVPFSILIVKILENRCGDHIRHKNNVFHFYLTIFLLIFIRFLSYLFFFIWSSDEIKARKQSQIFGGIRNFDFFYVIYQITDSLSLPIFFSLCSITAFKWHKINVTVMDSSLERRRKLAFLKKVFVIMNILVFALYLLSLCVSMIPLKYIDSEKDDIWLRLNYLLQRILLAVSCFVGCFMLFYYGYGLQSKMAFVSKKVKNAKIPLVKFRALWIVVSLSFLLRGAFLTVKIIIFFEYSKSVEYLIIETNSDVSVKLAAFLLCYYIILEWLPVCLFILLIRPFRKPEVEESPKNVLLFNYEDKNDNSDHRMQSTHTDFTYKLEKGQTISRENLLIKEEENESDSRKEKRSLSDRTF